MADNSTRQFYDRISAAYDTIADGGEHVAREHGLQMLAVHEGERALEIGYGTGHTIVALAKAVGDTGHVDGVDISDGMMTVASARVAKSEMMSRVSLQVGDVPPLNYPDATFDVVTLSFTLELFPLETIPTVLAEIRRVLVDGGRVGIVSMASVRPGEHASALEDTYKWMHRHFPHIVDCQPIDAEGFVQNSGLVIQQSERLSLFTMPVAAIVAVKPGAGAS
ncbi:MAG: methyltransferase domain-containing protein [Planctomycetaceae bacterium]|nr:methyltransferase domain-containing protein [Planctomycetaceae bacterium]